jgi:hydrogenase-4 component F
MSAYILLAFALPPLAITLLMLGLSRHRLGQDNRFLNWLSFTQAFIYLALSLWVMLSQQLPVYYLSNQYFVIDSLAIYEVFITSLVFLLAAIYARGYVAGLLDNNTGFF